MKYTFKDDGQVMFGELAVGKVSITLTGDKHAVDGHEEVVAVALAMIAAAAEASYAEHAPQQTFDFGDEQPVRKSRRRRGEDTAEPTQSELSDATTPDGDGEPAEESKVVKRSGRSRRAPEPTTEEAIERVDAINDASPVARTSRRRGARA